MAFNGTRLFRYALLFESAANFTTFLPCILAPNAVLSYLVKGPSQITPATSSLVQWIGGLGLAITVPLLLSYPNPTPSRNPGGQEVAGQTTAWRKLTYVMLGSGEVALGAIFAMQYLSGDSGMTDVALLTATGLMGTFLGMRVFFLCMKPSWMESQDNARKVR